MAVRLVAKRQELSPPTWTSSWKHNDVGRGPQTALWEAKDEILDELSTNRKLSGFDGGISPVKSACRQRLVGHYWRVYREQSANPEALLPVGPSSNRNRRHSPIELSTC
jgi:hypothetical protein